MISEVKKQLSQSLASQALIPLQELSKGRATMAVSGFFFGGKFGECFFDLRKIKNRIVAEAIRASRSIKNNSFCFPTKSSKRFSVARRGQNANKSPRPFVGRDLLHFAEYPRVVSRIIGILVRFVELHGGVAGGLH